MSVTKRDLPEIHVRRETKYGMDLNAAGMNYNHVPEEYLLSLSDDSGKLCTLVQFWKTPSDSEAQNDFRYVAGDPTHLVQSVHIMTHSKVND